MGNFISEDDAQKGREALEIQLKRVKKSPNVLVVGLPGSGKSSLISSFKACWTHHYEEVGTAGQSSDAASLTHHFERYNMFEHDEKDDMIKNFPVFYDMPGFNNWNDRKTRSMIEYILQGRVPTDTNPMDAVASKNLIHESDPTFKIDRIIFAHSCTVDIPEHLVAAVKEVSRELGVRVFGVLTKTDLKGRKISKKDFDLSIGTGGSPRSIEIELYHQGRAVKGKILDDHVTNYYMYLMLETLLNPNYRYKSAEGKSEETL